MSRPLAEAAIQGGRAAWLAGLERFLATRIGWWTTLALMCGLLLAPLLVTDVPAISDYPNHLARFFILARAGSDPVLDRMWQPDWHVIPDLGLDLVLPPLVGVLGLQAVGKLAVALSLLAPLFGALAYNRAAFGTRSYWPMTAGLMAYNLFFVLGIINYLIAVGAALAAAGLWLALRGHPLLLRGLAGAACATVLFFLHLFGVVYFAVLVGVAELAALLAAWREGRGPLRQGATSGALLAVTFAGPLILWRAVPAGPHGLVYGWSWVAKTMFFPSPFLSYRPLPGAFAGLVFVILAGSFLGDRRTRRAPGLGLALLGLAALYAGAPYAFHGGEYVDSRVSLMLGLTLSAGMRPVPRSVRWRRWGAAAVGAALGVAVASVGWVWGRHNALVAQVRASIAQVPPGSRVLVATAPFAWHNPWWEKAPPTILALGFVRLDYHLAALLAIERRAFWPLLFSDPSQHPIRVLPPYAALSASAGVLPDLPSLVAQRSSDPHWPRRYLKDWPAHFDYVLVFAAGAEQDLSGFLPDRLTLLNHSDFAALFRVRKAVDRQQPGEAGTLRMSPPSAVEQGAAKP